MLPARTLAVSLVALLAIALVLTTPLHATALLTSYFVQDIFEFSVLEKQPAGSLVAKLPLAIDSSHLHSLGAIRLEATRGDPLKEAPPFTIEHPTQHTAVSSSSASPLHHLLFLNLRTTRALEASAQSRYYLRAYATTTTNVNTSTSSGESSSGNTIWCSIVVRVVDGVNRAPVFTRSLYHALMYEVNAPDVAIVRVQALDGDAGANARITYHLAKAGDSADSDSDTDADDQQQQQQQQTGFNSGLASFHIKSDTGHVYVKQPYVSRELRDTYELSVLAIDNGPGRLTATARLVIRVLPQGDDAPRYDDYPTIDLVCLRLNICICCCCCCCLVRFEQDEYEISLPDTSDYASRPPVFVAKATSSSSRLAYSLYGNLNDLSTFEVEASTGAVRLVSKLDYSLKRAYKLTLIARTLDQQPSSGARALLHVRIVNVARRQLPPPVFREPFYLLVVYENVERGHVVGRVAAAAAAALAYSPSVAAAAVASNNISYSMDNTDEATMAAFGVDATSGAIFTTQRLATKYDKHDYEFYVRATNVLPAEDEDEDADAHSMQTMSNNNSSSSSSSVKVKVKVLDMNDNVPEFARSSYSLNISLAAAASDSKQVGGDVGVTTTPVGLPLLALSVVNRRGGDVLDYSFDYGNEDAMFALIRTSLATRVFVALASDTSARRTHRSSSSSNVEQEVEQRVLGVKVLDNQDGLYSICNVHVRIVRTAPPAAAQHSRLHSSSLVFDHDTFEFDVYEDAPLGTVVGSLRSSASAVDSLRVTYKLATQQASAISSANSNINNNNNELFRLDETSGRIYVSARLDRERCELVTWYVTANADAALDHALVTIRIRDVNDNAPVFTRLVVFDRLLFDSVQNQNLNIVFFFLFDARNQYKAVVYDNTAIGSVLLRIQAVDKDAPGSLNSLVRYSIGTHEQQAVVSIDPLSGIVRLARTPSSFTQPMQNVSVLASDQAAEHRGAAALSTSAALLVERVHAAESEPRFDAPACPLVFYAWINEPAGSVIGLIRASSSSSVTGRADLVYKLMSSCKFRIEL